MGKKGDLSDFECGMVVGARRAGLSISKTADLLGFSRTTISSVYREWSEKEKISSEWQLCGWKCLVDVRGERRMGRLVRDVRNLKQMGYSSRRLHRVLLLSAKNRKRLQFTLAHQNWTIEDWKNVAWSDESRFLLRHSDGRVRIWRKEHESMDPSCLVSTVQAGGGGVMVWGSTDWALFKRHSLPEYCCWPCPCLYDYSDQHLLMATSSRIMHRHKAQIISDWFLEHDNEFTLLK